MDLRHDRWWTASSYRCTLPLTTHDQYNTLNSVLFGRRRLSNSTNLFTLERIPVSSEWPNAYGRNRPLSPSEVHSPPRPASVPPSKRPPRYRGRYPKKKKAHAVVRIHNDHAIHHHPHLPPPVIDPIYRLEVAISSSMAGLVPGPRLTRNLAFPLRLRLSRSSPPPPLHLPQPLKSSSSREQGLRFAASTILSTHRGLYVA